MAINRLYSKQIKTYDLKEKNQMTIGETVRKAIKEITEGVLNLMTPKEFKMTDDEPELPKDGLMTKEKPKRARGKKGKFKADIKETKQYNEAWVGGKSPKRKSGQKTKRTSKKTS